MASADEVTVDVERHLVGLFVEEREDPLDLGHAAVALDVEDSRRVDQVAHRLVTVAGVVQERRRRRGTDLTRPDQPVDAAGGRPRLLLDLGALLVEPECAAGRGICAAELADLDEDQRDLGAERVRVLHGLPVHLANDVSLVESRLLGRTAGDHAGDDGARLVVDDAQVHEHAEGDERVAEHRGQERRPHH